MEKQTNLPKLNMDSKETGCCPKFDPSVWEEKLIELEGLPMVRATGRNFLHIPLDIGKVMTGTQKAIRQAGKEAPDYYLILSRDLSPWRSEHLFLTTGKVEGLENLSFKGLFLTKVYDGGFNEVPRWLGISEAFAKSQGYDAKTHYCFYTTCPKCAKHYGHNYVVIFTEV